MSGKYSELFGLIGIVAIVAVAALIATFLVARAFRRRVAATSEEPAFTLQELRHMHDRGQITKQEFEAMRAALIGAVNAGDADGAQKAKPR